MDHGLQGPRFHGERRGWRGTVLCEVGIKRAIPRERLAQRAGGLLRRKHLVEVHNRRTVPRPGHDGAHRELSQRGYLWMYDVEQH